MKSYKTPPPLMGDKFVAKCIDRLNDDKPIDIPFEWDTSEGDLSPKEARDCVVLGFMAHNLSYMDNRARMAGIARDECNYPKLFDETHNRFTVARIVEVGKEDFDLLDSYRKDNPDWKNKFFDEILPSDSYTPTLLSVSLSQIKDIEETQKTLNPETQCIDEAGLKALRTWSVAEVKQAEHDSTKFLVEEHVVNAANQVTFERTRSQAVGQDI